VSDPKQPNHYEQLKQIEREAERKAELEKKVELEQRTREENREQSTQRYERFVKAEIQKGEIKRGEGSYHVRRFDNDEVFRAQNERKMDAQKFERPDKKRDETEAEHKAASMEMTESRSARMQRLKDISAQIDREREEKGKDRDEAARDPSGRSR
jgi:hypothetical protein